MNKKQRVWSMDGWEIWKESTDLYIITHNGKEIDRCISFDLAYSNCLKYRTSI